MRIGDWHLRADWGHVAFASTMAAVTLAYLIDTVSTSMKTNNVLLVLPLAVLILALYVCLIVRSVKLERFRAANGLSATDTEGDGASRAESGGHSPDGQTVQSPSDLRNALVLLIGLGAYVALFQIIGLDVATFLFVAGGLVLLGVRRPLFVVLYAAIFTLVVVGGARLLLYYPMHTVLI